MQQDTQFTMDEVQPVVQDLQPTMDEVQPVINNAYTQQGYTAQNGYYGQFVYSPDNTDNPDPRGYLYRRVLAFQRPDMGQGRQQPQQ